MGRALLVRQTHLNFQAAAAVLADVLQVGGFIGFEADVNGIERHQRAQAGRIRRVAADEVADGEFVFAHATRHRRGDAGVAKVDAGGVNARGIGLPCRLERGNRRVRRLELAPRGGARGQHFALAGEFQFGQRELRAGIAGGGFCFGQTGREGGGVDLEQQRAGGDFIPRREMNGLQIAVHPRAQVNVLGGLEAARKFVGLGDFAFNRRGYGDRRWGGRHHAGVTGGRGFAAGDQRHREDPRQGASAGQHGARDRAGCGHEHKP